MESGCVQPAWLGSGRLCSERLMAVCHAAGKRQLTALGAALL